ncbi:MAG: TfoX/Sxy family protein [Chloroflexota bacterium]|nr:TfoX/Sxy family protein [Chloroflexota bacterium]MDE2775851.1 TfoX/Sxy family protein [Chloroflexota bacterium]MDE2911202.1 TfoX/Sxy family protein [Chloroflexota bacterium]
MMMSSDAANILQALTELKNIGPKSARRLLEAGIKSREQIEALGAVEVFNRLRQRYPASLTMLWALQGALLDLPYNQIPPEIKSALLDELNG